MSHDLKSLNDATKSIDPCPEMSRHVQSSTAEHVPPRPLVSSHVQQRPVVSSSSEIGKTKPFSTDLTPQQLAACRSLVYGVSSAVVAQMVGTSQRTINRWKRLPSVRAELQRLHDLIAVGLGHSSMPGMPTRRPNRPHRFRANDDQMSDEEVRETEAMIDEILGQNGRPK